MQFSPKKTERYLSALRIYLHNRILARGINKSRLQFAARLFICNLLYKAADPCPTDTALFCKVLLSSAQAQLLLCGRCIEVEVEGTARHLLDRDILTALLLEIANTATAVKVNIKSEYLAAFYRGKAPQKRLKAVIRAAGGTLLHITESRTHAVFLPLCPTAQKSEKITGAVELLTDPLSPVKIFISPNG